MRSRRHLKIGDVLSVKTPKGFGYLQYIGKHIKYGDSILVCPDFRSRPALIEPALFSNSYVAFYPATLAASRGLVAVVGHLNAPELPRRLRRAIIGPRGQVVSWVIEGSGDEQVKRELSGQELLLPLAEIWNHEFLIDKMSERCPFDEPREEAAQEGGLATSALTAESGDAGGLKAIANYAELDQPRKISHYLYFKKRAAAREAAAQLSQRGFMTKEEPGADGVNWLVLASHQSVPSEDALTPTREVMERITSKLGGEYDGWEIDLHRERAADGPTRH